VTRVIVAATLISACVAATALAQDAQVTRGAQVYAEQKCSYVIRLATRATNIPTTLPFVRREAVKALKASYPTQEAASEGISRALRDFYRLQYPGDDMSRRQDVKKAVNAASAIYRRNVFPEMTSASAPMQSS
jgi:hypothetical protein